MALWTAGRPALAAEAFLESIRLDASQPRNYYWLGTVFRALGRTEEALHWFKEGVRAAPAWKDNENYSHLAVVLMEFRLYGVAADFYSAATAVNPGLNDVLERVNAGWTARLEIERWVVHDLEEMISLCRKKRVKIVIMNYPANPDYPNWGRLSELIVRTAKNNKAAFVDNYSVFSALGAKGGAGGYFAADGHCNAKGYALVAESASEALLAAGVGAAR